MCKGLDRGEWVGRDQPPPQPKASKDDDEEEANDAKDHGNDHRRCSHKSKGKRTRDFLIYKFSITCWGCSLNRCLLHWRAGCSSKGHLRRPLCLLNSPRSSMTLSPLLSVPMSLPGGQKLPATTRICFPTYPPSSPPSYAISISAHRQPTSLLSSSTTYLQYSHSTTVTITMLPQRQPPPTHLAAQLPSPPSLLSFNPTWPYLQMAP